MKKKFTIELDKRYFNKKDLSEATLRYLTEEGHKCKLLDSSTIIIDEHPYTMMEWNITPLFPVQQVRFTLIK